MPATNRAFRLPRRALIRRTIAAKRAQHPELATVPTLAGLEAVVRRERIIYLRQNLHPRLAGVSLGMGGVTVISLNNRLDPSETLLTMAHELGHAWLHVEARALTALRAKLHDARGDRVYGALEAEADSFAVQLLGLDGSAYAGLNVALFERLSKSSRDDGAGR